MILIGGMFGALFSGIVADKMGRMKALYFIDSIYLLGTLICVLALDYWMMICGRFIVGIACGLASMIVSIIITEIAPSDIRGTVGVLNQFFNTFGALVALVVVAIFQHMKGDSLKWRYLLFLFII